MSYPYRVNLYVSCPACHHREQRANLTCKKCGEELHTGSFAGDAIIGAIVAALVFAFAFALYRGELARPGEITGLWVAVFFACFGPVLFRTVSAPRLSGPRLVVIAAFGGLLGSIGFASYAGSAHLVPALAAFAIGLVAGATARQVGDA